MWKTYVAVSEAGKVLGGCVLREHEAVADEEDPLTELSLLAIDGESQLYNLGYALIDALKKDYSRMVTNADDRATGFFAKMGFKHVPLRSKRRDRLPDEIKQSLPGMKLMMFEMSLDHCNLLSVIAELEGCVKKLTQVSLIKQQREQKAEAKVEKKIAKPQTKVKDYDQAGISINAVRCQAVVNAVHDLVPLTSSDGMKIHLSGCPLPERISTFLNSYQASKDLHKILKAIYNNLYGMVDCKCVASETGDYHVYPRNCQLKKDIIEAVGMDWAINIILTERMYNSDPFLCKSCKRSYKLIKKFEMHVRRSNCLAYAF